MSKESPLRRCAVLAGPSWPKPLQASCQAQIEGPGGSGCPRGPPLQWQNKAATSLGLLRRWLAKDGWTELKPWVWQHTNAHSRPQESRLSLEHRNALVPKLEHAIRHQWRAQQFLTWSLIVAGAGRSTLRGRGRLSSPQGPRVSVVSDAWLRVSQQTSGTCSLCGGTYVGVALLLILRARMLKGRIIG